MNKKMLVLFAFGLACLLLAPETARSMTFDPPAVDQPKGKLAATCRGQRDGKRRALVRDLSRLAHSGAGARTSTVNSGTIV